MAKLTEYLSNGKRVHKLINFSCVGHVVNAEKVTTHNIKNFSETGRIEDLEVSQVNFTLLEYLREYKMTPKNILKRRVRDVVNYVNSKPAELVIENRDLLINYLNDFLYQQIIKAINESDGAINIIYALGLNLFLSDIKPAKKLQIQLTKLRKQLLNTGVMNKMIQTSVKECYNEMWLSFIQSIDKTKIQETKKGILLGVNNNVIPIKS